MAIRMALSTTERPFWHCGAHCQAGIGLWITPIPYYQNLLFSVARGVAQNDESERGRETPSLRNVPGSPSEHSDADLPHVAAFAPLRPFLLNRELTARIEPQLLARFQEEGVGGRAP